MQVSASHPTRQVSDFWTAPKEDFFFGCRSYQQATVQSTTHQEPSYQADVLQAPHLFDHINQSPFAQRLMWIIHASSLAQSFTRVTSPVVHSPSIAQAPFPSPRGSPLPPLPSCALRAGTEPNGHEQLRVQWAPAMYDASGGPQGHGLFLKTFNILQLFFMLLILIVFLSFGILWTLFSPMGGLRGPVGELRTGPRRSPLKRGRSQVGEFDMIFAWPNSILVLEFTNAIKRPLPFLRSGTRSRRTEAY